MLGKIGRASRQDVKLSDIELLIGLTTAIRDGGERADDVFPPLGGPKPTNGAAPGDPDLEAKLRQGKAPSPTPTPTATGEKAEESRPVGDRMARPQQTTPAQGPQAASEAPKGTRKPREPKTEPAPPPAGAQGAAFASQTTTVACVICKKTVDLERDGISSLGGFRHEACSPLGLEADSDGEPPPDVHLAGDDDELE